VKAKMIDWWGPILIEYYAGSEGNGVTVSDSKQWLAHRGTVGRAVVGEIKILDDDGTELPSAKPARSISPVGRNSPITTTATRPRAPTTTAAGRRSATLVISTLKASSISPTARPT
jgi:hypothetical protein